MRKTEEKDRRRSQKIKQEEQDKEGKRIWKMKLTAKREDACGR